MKKGMQKLAAAVVLAVALGLLAGCGGTSEGKGSIKVGSKPFTESLVVSEIYALALEDAGYQVERVPGIAGSVIHTALVNNEIDLYPEYTGTGLLSILKLPMESDPQAVYDTVKAEYDKQFHITWLNPSPANDSQGLVIKTSLADRLGIKTISDLQANASSIRFASQGTFDEREDGIKGLEKLYGTFNWASSTVYENSLKYQVLKNDQADAAPAYTTEGQLVNTEEFRVLEDDKHFWPPYNLTPVVRNAVLEQHRDIAEILNAISPSLTTEAVISLNAQVDVEGKEYEAVAKEFYESIKKQ